MLFFTLLCFEVQGYNKVNLTKSLNQQQNVTAISKNNSVIYKFKNNNNTIITSGPYNNSHTNEFINSKIALIKPIFTDAAYNNKFYIFYNKYANISPKENITTDLDLLNSKISKYQSGSVPNVFAMLQLIKVIKWINNNTQINVLSDLDVDKGRLFDKNNHNLYDIIILGHQEYVTQKEYDSFRQFVSNGGIMILLDGNVFYAEIRYNDNNNTISLVKGHGWAYNGKTAWKSVNERWKDETKDWVGSNYLCYQCVKEFKNNPFGYLPHEEQYVTNSKDIILLNYNPILLPGIHISNVVIATYQLNYGRGKVISLGIYSDDIIQNENFIKFFGNIIIEALLHSA
jgi:hypothetical protein